MSKSKHTPKPWRVEGETVNAREIIAKRNTEIASLIADRHGVRSYKQMRANAHLIAAAPEMLEALKKIAGAHRDTSGDWISWMQDIALSAIAKAEGRDDD